jgi:aminoglycoside phosphotransferase (APT) family kinase protein
MPNLSMQTYQSEIQSYLKAAQPDHVPGWSPGKPSEIYPLGQGEYNMNFLIDQAQTKWVLRVNTGSQIGLSAPEQIEYEYKTLELLKPVGIAPEPYFLDKSMKFLPYGVFGMAFLPGEKLDYLRDLPEAARLFAQYHQLQVPQGQIHLIHEEQPLSLTYQRCLKMLRVYLESEWAEPNLRSYLLEVSAWAGEARHKESFYIEDSWNCIINTEVNNGNWIIDRQNNTFHLVDWEKPLWGDPSQDLSHFRVPTTTLWKTDFRMTETNKVEMMKAYKEAIADPHLRDTIEERTRLRDPFNCLRGVSWCAMAWVKYRSGEHLLKNVDTLMKLSMYTNLEFVRSLFDPYMSSS